MNRLLFAAMPSATPILAGCAGNAGSALMGIPG